MNGSCPRSAPIPQRLHCCGEICERRPGAARRKAASRCRYAQILGASCDLVQQQAGSCSLATYRRGPLQPAGLHLAIWQWQQQAADATTSAPAAVTCPPHVHAWSSMARSSHTAALLCLAATVALLAWPQCAAAAVPAAAAVVQGDTAPAGSCRVRWPNTCLCKQGSCEGCAHCAGCDDNLCVAPPFARVAAPRTDTTEGLIDGACTGCA